MLVLSVVIIFLLNLFSPKSFYHLSEYNISNDLDFFTYVQLELHRILAQNKTTEPSKTPHNNGEKPTSSSWVSLDYRNEMVNAFKNLLYVLRESAVCSIVQISPSFPSLCVSWAYTRVRHAEYYIVQPMDSGLDMLAWWLLLVTMLTISMDICEFLCTKLRFYKVEDIVNNDRQRAKQRACCLSALENTHRLLQYICYLNSSLIVSNLLVWVILAIAVSDFLNFFIRIGTIYY